jgi:hypothetical protein
MVHKKQIILFDDVIPEETCNKYINLLDNTPDLDEEKWGNNTNVQCKYLPSPPTKEMDDEIYQIVTRLASKIQKYNPSIKISTDSGYQLRKIHGETRLHSDGTLSVPSRNPRSMSLIIALNDDYEGGEMYFPNQEFKIRLKRGQAIAFPPYWTHPHGVTSPLNGTYRYTINTWFLEKENE